MTNQRKAKPTITTDQQKAYDKLTTKSGQFRYLESIGMSRADISRFTGAIYQHVRNVLEQNVKNPVDKF